MKTRTERNQDKVSSESPAVCNGCGALVRPDYPYCPYCGRMMDVAAERDYMDKLEGIRRDMADLEKVPSRAMGGAVRGQWKRVVKIAIIVIMILCALLAVMRYTDNDKYASKEKSEYLWMEENRKALDEAYENEDYAVIAQIQDQGYEKGYYLSHWKHALFWTEYTYYETAVQLMSDPESTWERREALTSALELITVVKGKNNLDAEEQERLEPLADEVYGMILKEYSISEKQVRELIDREIQSGYSPYSEISDFAKEVVGK